MAGAVHKRKRESGDQGNLRAAPATDFEQTYLQGDESENADNSVDFAAMLAQHNAGPGEVAEEQQHQQQTQQQQAGQENGQSASDTATAALAQYHTMTVPQPTEQSFMTQTSEVGERPSSSSFNQGGDSATGQRSSNYADFEMGTPQQGQSVANGDESSPTGIAATTPGGSKPAVGSDEWHKVRRDNHKEVERRRRETINEGINELAKIVPGCEKNKGSILARAVQFITQLKENETQNIEKWTLEKLLTEQAIAELSSSCDKLKAECQRAWAEVEKWKIEAKSAGADVDEKDAASEDAP